MLKLDKELKAITNPDIVSFVEHIFLKHVPVQFWEKPASSTGKYHPESSGGYGGLLRHTKQVFWIANTICDSGCFQANRDIVLAACLLHDAWKYEGNSKYTIRNHASLAVERIATIVFNEDMFKNGAPAWYGKILECIQSHNGRFTKEWFGEMSIEQKIVHIADYVASRPFLNFVEERCQK